MKEFGRLTRRSPEKPKSEQAQVSETFGQEVNRIFGMHKKKVQNMGTYKDGVNRVTMQVLELESPDGKTHYNLIRSGRRKDRLSLPKYEGHRVNVYLTEPDPVKVSTLQFEFGGDGVLCKEEKSAAGEEPLENDIERRNRAIEKLQIWPKPTPDSPSPESTSDLDPFVDEREKNRKLEQDMGLNYQPVKIGALNELFAEIEQSHPWERYPRTEEK